MAVSGINFVVLGVGQIGCRHARILQNLPGANLVALVEPDAVIHPDLQAEFQVPVFPDLKTLSAAAMPVQVISVCSPNFLHAPHVLEALHLGYQVVCEKPLALTIAECDEILNLAAAMQKRVYCVQQLTYGPVMAWVKGLVYAATLGQIFKVQVNAFWNRDERYFKPESWRGKADKDGGPLFTQFSHFVHALYWLFGEMAVQNAGFYNFRTPKLTAYEDSGELKFRFNNGGVGSMHYSTAAWDKNMLSEVVILAQHGSLKLSGQYLEKLEYCHVNGVGPPEDLLAGSLPNLHQEFYLAVLQDLQKTKSRDKSVWEGREVVQFIEQVYAYRNKSF